MIGQKLIADQVLKILNKTLGKKFKIVEMAIDKLQGIDAVVDDLQEENKEIKAKLKQIEERIDENKHCKKKGCGNTNFKV
tara:strand:+ start:423 stop:662 length:240 start_codon:yes stop_codon:yes gene_type:complete